MRMSRLLYATRSSSVYDNIVYNLISFNNRLKLVGGGLLAWRPSSGFSLWHPLRWIPGV